MESDCPFYTYVAAADVDDGHGLFVQQYLSGEPAGNGAGERKRRFTEEQVRSLESTFQSRRAAKLEPREKAELARELGLQPRQVAIWFQNKRARWRSKQLETDFAELRAGYDHLHASVESLRQEKLTLAAQLEELKEKLNERQDQSASSIADVDEKRQHDASCLAGSAAAVADAVSEDSAAAGWYDYDYDHHLAYGGGLPEPLCATPELWETTTWPLVEWNAVA